jgi:tetratricopeptide (TPR) repeat protein
MGGRSLAIALFLAWAVIARAQPHRNDNADPDTEIATREFRRGLDLYNHERYAEAIVAFEKARAVKPSPAFDYNIARCYDRLAEWRPAIEGYERYLRAPGLSASDVAETRARVEVLKQRVAAAPTPTVTRATRPPEPTPTAPALVARPAAPRARAAIIAGATVGGLGLALVGAGVAFGVLAQRASDDLSALDRMMGTYDSARYRAGQTDQTLEAVCLGIGGAALVTGVLVLALGRREAHP